MGVDLENIIKIINDRASELTKNDVEWIVNELMEYFKPKVHSLSRYVYGSEQGLPLAAFKEWSRETLEKGVETFLFKSEHWRSKRDIGPYLSTCLSKLADQLKSNIEFIKKVSIPICPACKTLNNREFLIHEGPLLRCSACTKEYERLVGIKNRNSCEEYEYRLRKVFSLHSRKGRMCPDCERFIPESFINNNNVSCPYDNCSWFGKSSDLKPMNHPLGKSSGMTVSMQTPIAAKNSIESNTEMGDVLDAGSINPDIRMEQAEKYYKELKIARNVIGTQKKRLEIKPKNKVLKKYLMYQAFEEILEQDPAAMISYLIYGKSLKERPFQSLIFQKYIQLIENNLPFSIKTDDGDHDVYSLLDLELNLFLGMSEYQGVVRDSGLVSNNTHEIFIGAKCNGPCFIGWLCDIQDENGNSLLNEVEYYSFSNVKMKSSIKPGTLVKVIHFRIPPHYEMYSLVNLQRIRRKIVDSIYKRLNGESRPLKSNDTKSVIEESLR